MLDEKIALHSFLLVNIRRKNIESVESIWGKHGNDHICHYIYNAPVIFSMKMWPIPSFPQIYPSVFTILGHVCEERFVQIHFFRPVKIQSELEICLNVKIERNLSLYMTVSLPQKRFLQPR